MCRRRPPASSDPRPQPPPGPESRPAPTPAHITNVNTASPFCFLSRKKSSSPFASLSPPPRALHRPLGPGGHRAGGGIFPGTLGGVPTGPGSSGTVGTLMEAAPVPEPSGSGFLTEETSGICQRRREGARDREPGCSPLHIWARPPLRLL